MRIRQVIVFGGAGFIGSHLVACLAASKSYDRIVSVDINEPRIRVPDVEYLKHDVRREISPDLSGGQPIDIFNLAAVHTTPGHEDWEYYQTNVLGALQVCKFASAVNAHNLVFSSSISVYGPSERPLDEDAVLAPESAYGDSKLAAEQVHQLWQSQDPRRRLTVVRPAVIFGLKEGGNFTRLARMLAKGTFVYPGRKDTIKSCGYVRDLVSSMIYMSGRNDGVLTYNFCFPRRYTTADICEAFCEVAGYRVPRLVLPMSIMIGVATPFEWLHRLGIRTGINRARVKKLWFSTNIVPRELEKNDFVFEYDLVNSLREWKSLSKAQDFE